MQALKYLVVTIPVTLILDFVWLGVIAKSFYWKQLGPLLRQSGGAMAPIWASAAVVYLLIPIGISFFVMPLAEGRPTKALGLGMLFGAVLYGVYDFTNHSLLKDWPFAVVVVDLLWGAILCGATALITSVVVTRLGWKI